LLYLSAFSFPDLLFGLTCNKFQAVPGGWLIKIIINMLNDDLL